MIEKNLKMVGNEVIWTKSGKHENVWNICAHGSPLGCDDEWGIRIENSICEKCE